MMKLVLDDEERMVRDSAELFLTDTAGPSLLREVRDSGNPLGYAEPLWQQMIDLGWPGILVPEEFDGLGFSQVAMGQIMEQAGMSLASSPLFSTAVLGATALTFAGNQQQKTEFLPKIAAGDLTFALAVDETARHNADHIRTVANKTDPGYSLTGSKCFVVNGQSADMLIVAARTSGSDTDKNGISLFIIASESAGIESVTTSMMDSRPVATIHLKDVHADESQRLGALDQGGATLAHLLTVANVHLAAELLGISGECFKRTLAYLKDRKQFGVAIGSFQALQHRAALLWVEIELCKSGVIKALRALDAEDKDAALLASAIKVKACKTAELATNEAIQMHGGIGMTDAFDVGFFIKRARVAQMLFGDCRYHLNKFAEYSGY